MSVYVSEQDRTMFVLELSGEVRTEIEAAVAAELDLQGLEDVELLNAKNEAVNKRVCDLEGMIDIEYLPESLSFYVVNNLRSQQDGTSFDVIYVNRIDEAIKLFNEFPKEYTSAIGGVLGPGREIDLIHRRVGEPVQVNDYKYIPGWKDSPLVARALQAITQQLGVEYESDVRIINNRGILIPLATDEDKRLNSYFMDKYLDAPDHRLLAAINEVFITGKGWIAAQKFMAMLERQDEYASARRLKVEKFNVNYVDLNHRTGQADIGPHGFALLMQQTKERTAQRPPIDEVIDAAKKTREQQKAEKQKQRGKKKGRDDKHKDWDR